MTDSDHITSGSAIILMDGRRGALGSSRVTEGGSHDPALSLWHDFVAARTCARKLTGRQQAIESVMVEHIGFPVVRIKLPDGGHVSVVGREDAREILGGELSGTKFGEVERASLEAHEARWSAIDAELGYSAALRAEARALDRMRELAERLWATPAASLGGVIAKLDALLSEGAPSSVAGEFPWPQLRAMRADLEKLHVASPSPLRR
ncbi:MAG: hypothetical protein KGO02_14440 [Alphaproteobacteria bacterium]|nr:hypothetical protein [Alphaproteobacteria bacterium]